MKAQLLDMDIDQMKGDNLGNEIYQKETPERIQYDLSQVFLIHVTPYNLHQAIHMKRKGE